MTESDEQRAARYAELEASYPTMTTEEYQRRTRRSLLTGGAAALAGLAGAQAAPLAEALAVIETRTVACLVDVTDRATVIACSDVLIFDT